MAGFEHFGSSTMFNLCPISNIFLLIISSTLSLNMSVFFSFRGFSELVPVDGCIVEDTFLSILRRLKGESRFKSSTSLSLCLFRDEVDSETLFIWSRFCFLMGVSHMTSPRRCFLLFSGIFFDLSMIRVRYGG